MKKIMVTEEDVRAALGPRTAYSPLGNRLIRRLFSKTEEKETIDNRLDMLERQVRLLIKRME